MKKKNTNKQYARALYDTVQGLKGEKLHQILKKFVDILLRSHKLHQTEKIIQEFVRHSKKMTGIVEIEVTSARELDTRTLTRIKKVFSEKVESVEKVDNKLLGGVRIRLDDKILDASLKTQLDKMKQSLTR